MSKNRKTTAAKSVKHEQPASVADKFTHAERVQILQACGLRNGMSSDEVHRTFDETARRLFPERFDS